MVYWLSAFCIMLIVAVLALLIKIRSMQKGADELAAAVSGWLQANTNTLPCLSCGDRHMRKLAAAINRQLALLRREHLRYEQGDREMKEAIANISHDLRTPLTAVCGYLSLLEKEEKSETVSRYLSLMQNRTEALRQLMEELFQYSVLNSVQSGQQARVVLNHALEESLASFYSLFQTAGITPQIALPAQPVERFLERDGLMRVFSNIISNAVKYSDGDFVVSMDLDGKITFSNSARGMTPVMAGRLFDRFYTVQSGENATGLGFSIAKLLTQRMGGQIFAACQNERLHITLYFPNAGQGNEP